MKKTTKQQTISKEDAENFLKEVRAKELEQAQKDLEAWATKYQVNIDVEFAYNSKTGLQKRFLIVDLIK